MPRICVLTLFGLPGLGKTTFCDQMLLRRFPFTTIHICYDDFLHYGEELNDVNYKEVRLLVLQEIVQLIESLKTTSTIPPNLEKKLRTSLGNKRNSFLVMCDDNNYYRGMRYKIYQLCRNHQVGYGQIFFDCNAKVSFERNSLRPQEQQIPHEILQRMSARLQPPDPKTYSFEKQTLTLNPSDSNFNTDDILSFIESSFENIPIVPSEHTVAPVTVIHRVDILLRRHIKDIVTLEKTAAAKKAKVTSLNAKRKDILCNLRSQKPANLNDEEIQELLNSLR